MKINSSKKIENKEERNYRWLVQLKIINNNKK